MPRKVRGRIDVKHCHDKQWQVVRVNVSYVKYRNEKLYGWQFFGLIHES